MKTLASEPVVNKQVLPTKHTKDGIIETISGQVIKRPFINQAGQTVAGSYDYYLSASIQDYFIKFCESQIAASDLDKFVDQAVTLEAIKKDGPWDTCDASDNQQSRTGLYVQVTAIKAPK